MIQRQREIYSSVTASSYLKLCFCRLLWGYGYGYVCLCIYVCWVVITLKFSFLWIHKVHQKFKCATDWMFHRNCLLERALGSVRKTDLNETNDGKKNMMNTHSNIRTMYIQDMHTFGSNTSQKFDKMYAEFLLCCLIKLYMHDTNREYRKKNTHTKHSIWPYTHTHSYIELNLQNERGRIYLSVCFPFPRSAHFHITFMVVSVEGAYRIHVIQLQHQRQHHHRNESFNSFILNLYTTLHAYI